MEYFSAINGGYKFITRMHKVAAPGSSAQIRTKNVNYIFDVVISQGISNENLQIASPADVSQLRRERADAGPSKRSQIRF